MGRPPCVTSCLQRVMQVGHKRSGKCSVLNIHCGSAWVQVHSRPGPTEPLMAGETCSHDAEVGSLTAAVPALGADAPGAVPTERQGIRSVHISMGLMDEFLK